MSSVGDRETESAEFRKNIKDSPSTANDLGSLSLSRATVGLIDCLGSYSTTEIVYSEYCKTMIIMPTRA